MRKLEHMRHTAGRNALDSIGQGGTAPGQSAPVRLGPIVPKVDRVKADEAAFQVPLRLIDEDLGQPRRSFDPQELERTADSLRQVGQLLAIPVLHDTETNRYIIVDGARRYRAAKLADLGSLLVRVWWSGDPSKLDRDQHRTLMTDVRVCQLSANLHREELNPIDVARSIHELRDTFGISQRVIEKRLGVSQSFVSKSIALLSLPHEVQELISSGKLACSTARVFDRLPDPVAIADMAQRAVAERWTAAQAKAAVTEVIAPESDPLPFGPDSHDPINDPLIPLESPINDPLIPLESSADDPPYTQGKPGGGEGGGAKSLPKSAPIRPTWFYTHPSGAKVTVEGCDNATPVHEVLSAATERFPELRIHPVPMGFDPADTTFPEFMRMWWIVQDGIRCWYILGRANDEPAYLEKARETYPDAYLELYALGTKLGTPARKK